MEFRRGMLVHGQKRAEVSQNDYVHGWLTVNPLNMDQESAVFGKHCLS